MGDIDQLLIELSEEDTPGSIEQETVPATQTKALGFVIIAVVLLFTWLPWALLLAPLFSG